MLLEFRVANFLSFKEEVVFSLVASAIKEHRASNVALVNGRSILKSGVIYGANASGKSNLLDALGIVSTLVRDSSRESIADQPLPIHPYRLCENCETDPSRFEVIVAINKVIYRYGFEATTERIVTEWLYKVNKRTDALLFLRDGNDYIINSGFKEGKGLEAKTRNNSLFLSVCAQFNGVISLKMQSWFNNCRWISGLDEFQYENVTRNILTPKEKETESGKELREKFKNTLKILLKTCGCEVEDIIIDDTETELKVTPSFSRVIRNRIEKKESKKKVIFLKKKYDDNDNYVGLAEFDLNVDESEGTRKLFKLMGPIYETLRFGYVLIVDELDARLHPLMTRLVSQFFNSEKGNQLGAQLIFATHDTSLLNSDIFRRDQIWFAEKRKTGSTDLYSLSEYKLANKIRKDASFEKDYLNGRYGSIPFIGSENFLENFSATEVDGLQ